MPWPLRFLVFRGACGAQPLLICWASRVPWRYLKCFLFNPADIKGIELIRIMRTVGALLRDESGATAIEHRLIGIVTTGQGIGPYLNTNFTSINNSLK